MRTVGAGDACRRAPASPRAAALLLCCTVSALFGCTQPEAPRTARQPASIYALRPDGHGVAGARVWADGRELGSTNAEGHLVTVLEVGTNARVVVTAACPPAYRTLDERRELAMPQLHASNGQRAAPTVQLTITCQPLELLAALVVRLRGESSAGLPIRVRDQVVGQTGPDGTAHLVLRARPNASLTVELDTSAEPQLEPRNPVQTFQLGKESSVLVFDQTLTRPRGAHHARRQVHFAGPTRGLPYRVD